MRRQTSLKPGGAGRDDLYRAGGEGLRRRRHRWGKAPATNKEMDKLDHMTTALQALCQGLAQLSQGLRATSIKLGHLESTVRQLKDPRREFNR
jgi:hypothetical protein